MYKYLVTAALGISALAAAAQDEQKIKCVVKDEHGKPAKDVRIVPHNSEDTLVTNASGAFSIGLAHPAQQVSVFAKGYGEQQALISSGQKCIIKLVRDEDAEPADDNDSEE